MEPLVSVDTSQDQEEEEEAPPSDAEMAERQSLPDEPIALCSGKAGLRAALGLPSG
jgi:hypothetical protein